MIRGIRLDPADREGPADPRGPAPALRSLLRRAGLCGPWVHEEGIDVLSIREDSGGTTIAAGPPMADDAPAGQPEGPAPLVATPATLVSTRFAGFQRPLVFPVRRPLWHEVRPSLVPHAPRVERLLVVRESGAVVALAHPAHGDVGPALRLGARLSELAGAARDDCCFDGYGQVVALLGWWLRERLEGRVLTLSPWPRGAPPLLASLDIEGRVARRSVGRTVFRLPPRSRPLLEIARLDLIRPLRGRRVLASSNRLRDPDGQFTSRRVTVDLRRARRGCAAADPRVVQWQVHVRLPRRPEPLPTDDPGLVQWMDEILGAWTAFHCGGIPPAAAARPETGFHGTDHRHFHQMSAVDLRAELTAGIKLLAGTHPRSLIRAPGLLWNRAYFDAVGDHGYAVEASFRNVSAFQPSCPIRTARGWWQLPVNANLLTGPDPASLIASARDAGAMLSLHCHDHELTGASDRGTYRHRVEAFRSAGFVPMGHAELTAWLEDAERAAVHRITSVADGSLEVVVEAPRGTCVRVDPARDPVVLERDGITTIRLEPAAVPVPDLSLAAPGTMETSR